MNNPLVIVAAVGLAIAIGIFLFRYFSHEKPSLGGFKDWVQNPEYKSGAATYFAARDAIQVPDNISDAEIQQMVDRLFIQKDDDFNFERLELVGVKAVPFLIKALNDPKTWTATFERGHVFDPKSPFERICRLLAAMGPISAAKTLTKYFDHNDRNFRRSAALTMGTIGSSECIEPLRTALADESDTVRTPAIQGILRGFSAERCEAEFLQAMFSQIEELISRPDHTIDESEVKLLLAIDTERARSILLSPEIFGPDRRATRHIINALNEADQKIPHEILLPILEHVKPRTDTFPHDAECVAALVALSQNPTEDAEDRIRAELLTTSRRVREGAETALSILAGVDEARRLIFEIVKDRGFDALTVQQKYYYSVFVYDSEVRNGGHSQYFVNSSGDNWEIALSGLKAIGGDQPATVLKQATSLFGSKGPSVESDLRHQQLSRFSQRKLEALRKLDDAYYDCATTLSLQMTEFVISNKHQFNI